MADVQIDGYSRTKKIEGTPKNFSVTTLRFSSVGKLDVFMTGDGSKSVLQMLQEVAQQIVDLELPNPVPSNWTQVVKIPEDGREVTITFGVRSEFEEG